MVDEITSFLIVAAGGLTTLVLSVMLFKTILWYVRNTEPDDAKYNFICEFQKAFYLAATLLGISIVVGLINLNSKLLDTFLAIALITLITYSLFVLIDALVTAYSTRIENKNKIKIDAFLKTLKTSAKIIVILLSITMTLKTLGIDILPIVSLTALVGAALIIAFQDTLSNFFAGVYLTVDKPIKIGDYVKIENNQEGYVVAIGWRNTQIRTASNNLVIFPNIKIAQNAITNYYSPTKDIAVEIKWVIAYNSNLEKVEKITIDAAREVQKSTKGTLPDFEPILRFISFNEKGIEMSIRIKVAEFSDTYIVTHEFIKALIKKYKKEKISFYGIDVKK